MMDLPLSGLILAPFNVGIITSGLRSLNQGTALSPSLSFFSGDSATGLFSPALENKHLSQLVPLF